MCVDNSFDKKYKILFGGVFDDGGSIAQAECAYSNIVGRVPH